jgi:4-amino-4-deoxy-L-arabinose transferase-like glycosyltransferase
MRRIRACSLYDPKQRLWVFLGLLTVLRLVYAAEIELFPDESYYFMWSERMDVSYFSKGPGVAAAIWLGTHLFGANEFGVRFCSPLFGLGTSLLLFSFARRLYGEPVGIWTAVMINLLPIFNVGSLVMTIDTLSIFFWTAALYTFWLALERSPDFSKWWPATGALIGFGFLSKYTNAMQLVSIVLLLAMTPKYRREFRMRVSGACSVWPCSVRCRP